LAKMNSDGISINYNKEFIDAIGRQLPKGLILDIGCGEGLIASSLKRKWYGIDSNPYYCKNDNYEKIICGKFMNTRFNQKFDGVIALQVLHHMPKELDAVISKIYSMLKANGKLILYEPNSDNLLAKFFVTVRLPGDHIPLKTEKPLSLDEIKKACSQAGFRKVSRLKDIPRSAQVSIKSKTGNPLYSRAMKYPIALLLNKISSLSNEPSNNFVVCQK
jgi:SAM-dependent methyltransferase